jgi:hypothetical protein
VESSTLLAILARACQNPAYQWLLFREGVNNISQVYHLDPALPHGKAPRSVPRMIHFPGCGVVVARTGMDARDTYLGVKAADIPHLNHHCQMDGGSIAIHAHGRELLAKLDHWPYPREAPKDPRAPRPSRPGLFDEQLKRYMRWDLDSVAAPGHNIAVVEGQFPQPRLGVRPRIRVLSSDEGGDVITIDSSAYYRPMASLARRMVVFLRPATFVVIDQLASGRPVRTRLQYHYHDRAAIDGRDIRIGNGRATLLVRTLWPAADDDLVVGLDERHTFYETPTERVSRRNRFAYVENLWRKKKLVFVTLLQAGVRGSKAPAVTLRGDPLRDGRCQLTQAGRGGWTVDLDLDQWSAALSKP